MNKATAWCFCTAAASLMSSCCGNDKPSTEAPGAASGRKRSVLLLLMAIIIAFAFQYGVAVVIADFDYSHYVIDAWLDGCQDYETDILVKRCAGYAGVYRSAFGSVLFYLLAAIGVALKPTANREAWPAKYVLFVFLVLGMCFIPNEPLFLTVYLNIARIGGILFILVQQIVFVDLAYNWNDSWVERSNAAETEESGSGKKWLVAILVSASILFTGSIVAWGLLFHFYGGCPTNTAFIAITIAFCILISVAQLSGEEGSLLGSAMVTAYATSLCYSAVAKNPDESCNPSLGEDDILGIFIGVTLTLITLGYAGFSATADKTMSTTRESEEEKHFDSENQGAKPQEKTKVTGFVTGADYGTVEDEDEGTEEEKVPNSFSNSWRLNLVLAVVSCWFSMAMTAWGSIQSGGDAANPQVGEVSMWMIIATQWIALTLYLWTLVVPRLFPDREFS